MAIGGQGSLSLGAGLSTYSSRWAEHRWSRAFHPRFQRWQSQRTEVMDKTHCQNASHRFTLPKQIPSQQSWHRNSPWEESRTHQIRELKTDDHHTSQRSEYYKKMCQYNKWTRIHPRIELIGKKKYIRNRLINILREGMRECYIQIGVLNHHGEMLFSA